MWEDRMTIPSGIFKHVHDHCQVQAKYTCKLRLRGIWDAADSLSILYPFLDKLELIRCSWKTSAPMRNKLGAKMNGIMQPDLDHAIPVLSLSAKLKYGLFEFSKLRKSPPSKTEPQSHWHRCQWSILKGEEEFLHKGRWTGWVLVPSPARHHLQPLRAVLAITTGFPFSPAFHQGKAVLQPVEVDSSPIIIPWWTSRPYRS